MELVAQYMDMGTPVCVLDGALQWVHIPGVQFHFCKMKELVCSDFFFLR